MEPVTSLMRQRWMIVLVLWFVYLLNYLDRQIVFSVLPQLRVQLGFSNTQLGLIAAIFLWVYSLSSVAMGRLADICRRDVLIVACLVLWSLATLGSALSRSPDTFLGWEAVIGLSESLYLPAAVSLIVIFHPGDTRSRALTLHQTAQTVGVVLGGIVGAALAERFGWRAIFAVLSGIGLLYSPFLWLRIRGTGMQMPIRVRKRISQKGSGVFSSICFRWLLAAFAMDTALVWEFYTWFSLHLYDDQHLSMAKSSFLAAAYVQLSTFIGMAFWGILADKAIVRVPAARFIIVGLGALCCAPFGYLGFELRSLAWIKVAAICFGFFSAAVASNIVSATYDVVGPSNHGLAVGILNLVGGIAGGFTTLAMGFWRNSAGSLMKWAAAVTGFAAIGLFVVTFKFHAKERIELAPHDHEAEVC